MAVYWSSGKYATLHGWQLDKGLVGIEYAQPMKPGHKYRVYTHLEGFPEYHYMIDLDPDLNWFPLQHGNGRYTVKVLEESSPGTNKYYTRSTGWVDVDMAEPLDVFLASNFYMEWDRDMPCIQAADSLCAGLPSDAAKAEALWGVIVKDYVYDYELAANVKYNYTPSLMGIYISRKGICFGLTSLYNSQLRSQGIRAKMLHGIVNAYGAYHAWSEVMLDGEWRHVDITNDTGEKGRRGFLSGIFGPEEYTVRFVY